MSLYILSDTNNGMCACAPLTALSFRPRKSYSNEHENARRRCFVSAFAIPIIIIVVVVVVVVVVFCLLLLLPLADFLGPMYIYLFVSLLPIKCTDWPSFASMSH